MNRILSLEGVSNIRELGGITNKSGKQIREKLLIRSGSLYSATEKDLEFLEKNYQLSLVIDLRTAEEAKRKPDSIPSSAEYLSLPVFDRQLPGISHEESQGSLGIPDMPELYRAILADETCRKNLSAIIQAIVFHDYSKGSVLWHCTEGKDRCGIVTALILHLLQVDYDTIRADYLLTNLSSQSKADEYRRQMLAAGKTEQEADAIRNVFLAKEEYLSSLGDLNVLHFPEEWINSFQHSVLL